LADILIFYKTKIGQDIFSLDVWARRGALKSDISEQEILLDDLVIAIKSQCIKQSS
jgi:hypothetical protein